VHSKELPCRRDNHTLEFLQNQQVFVAGHNRVGLSTDRAAEHREIFEIPQFGWCRDVGGLYHSREHALFAHHFRDGPSANLQSRLKMWTSKHALQFCEQLIASEEMKLAAQGRV